MDFHQIYLFCLLINIFLAEGVNSKCPSQCLCFTKKSYMVARCINANIVDVNLEIPNNVEIYDLSNNSIKNLEDKCFKNMQLTSLVEINLSNNKIDWIGLHALAGLTKLEVLNLSGNRMQSLPPDIFWYNGKLKSLDLSRNKLQNINNIPFLQHTNLQVLNLSNSQIPHIPDKMFTQLPNLINLDLSKNYMINLKISALKPLANLEKLNLDGNQWHCDEAFTDLQSWILSQDFEYDQQCVAKKPKMFEKIISQVPVDTENESSIENLDELMNAHENLSNFSSSTETSPAIVTGLVKVYPLITFVLGTLVGLLSGMIISYCWLTRCHKSTCHRSYSNQRDRPNDIRTHLISANRIISNSESTPVMRRQFSPQNSFFRTTSWQLRDETENYRRGPPMISAPPIVYRAICGTNRSETPPPTYGQCFSDSVIST